jgi:hypothetical protein
MTYAPFSLVVPGGLPKHIHDPEDPKGLAFKQRIAPMLETELKPKTLGRFAGILATGATSHLFDASGLIEAIPEHGITFPNPNKLAEEWSECEIGVGPVMQKAAQEFLSHVFAYRAEQI